MKKKPNKNIKTKNKADKDFFEYKWFKLICLFSFFGWLFYMTYTPFEINKNELIELNATVIEKLKSGGQRNPIKLNFKTKEYSSRFGIYKGGVFGRWTEVKNALEPNSSITIKIHKNNKSKLNTAEEVIPIYYLQTDKLGLVFNEDEFNQGEKSSEMRFRVFFLVVFLLWLWKIITE
jgi:hypothetical protein